MPGDFPFSGCFCGLEDFLAGLADETSAVPGGTWRIGIKIRPTGKLTTAGTPPTLADYEFPQFNAASRIQDNADT